eukprot:COSAG06_NODE_59094_length_275_cov_0.590909_1_plen_50_part_01
MQQLQVTPASQPARPPASPPATRGVVAHGRVAAGPTEPAAVLGGRRARST